MHGHLRICDICSLGGMTDLHAPSGNKTSEAVQFLLGLSDGHVPKIMQDSQKLKAICEKYAGMERGLKEISNHAKDVEEAPLTTARHLITIARHWLDFDPLNQ